MKIVTMPDGVRVAKLTFTEVDAIIAVNLAIIAVARDVPDSVRMNIMEREAASRINHLMFWADYSESLIKETIKAHDELKLPADEFTRVLSNPGTTSEKYLGLNEMQRHTLRRFKHAQRLEEMLKRTGFDLDPHWFEMNRWLEAPKADDPQVIEAQAITRAAKASKTKKERAARKDREGRATEAAKDTTPNAAFHRERDNIVLKDRARRLARENAELFAAKQSLTTTNQQLLEINLDLDQSYEAEKAKREEEREAHAAEIAKLRAELEAERAERRKLEDRLGRLSIDNGLTAGQVFEQEERDHGTTGLRRFDS